MKRQATLLPNYRCSCKQARETWRDVESISWGEKGREYGDNATITRAVASEQRVSHHLFRLLSTDVLSTARIVNGSTDESLLSWSGPHESVDAKENAHGSRRDMCKWFPVRQPSNTRQDDVLMCMHKRYCLKRRYLDRRIYQRSTTYEFSKS